MPQVESGPFLQLSGIRVPQLVIEAPDELSAARERLRQFDTNRLRGLMRLIGLHDPGAPIRVVLAPESAAVAQGVSPSTAGFAVPGEGVIVLFPSRSPAYPHDTLEDVLHHEVAHVLMTRAASGMRLPRWFHEGVAVVAERAWGFEDRARLIGELVFMRRTPLDRLDTFFAAGDTSAARAYTLSAAFVRDLMAEHGSEVAARILRRVAAGERFDEAFLRTTGRSIAAADRAFWDRHRFWNTVGPFLTTPTALWMIVTVIALYAIIRRRQQRAALRKQWDEEGTE
jgi:hypothetical protein